MSIISWKRAYSGVLNLATTPTDSSACFRLLSYLQCDSLWISRALETRRECKDCTILFDRLNSIFTSCNIGKSSVFLLADHLDLALFIFRWKGFGPTTWILQVSCGFGVAFSKEFLLYWINKFFLHCKRFWWVLRKISR